MLYWQILRREPLLLFIFFVGTKQRDRVSHRKLPTKHRLGLNIVWDQSSRWFDSNAVIFKTTNLLETKGTLKSITCV